MEVFYPVKVMPDLNVIMNDLAMEGGVKIIIMVISFLFLAFRQLISCNSLRQALSKKSLSMHFQSFYSSCYEYGSAQTELIS